MIFLGFIENLKSFTYDEDDLWDFCLNNVEQFEGVNRLDELIDLIIKIRKDNGFFKVASLDKIGEKTEMFSYDINKIPLHAAADKGLGISSLFPLYIPSITHKIVDADSLACLFSMIQFSFNSCSGHLLSYDEDKLIKLSDIIYCLTFFVEDFDNLDNEIVDYGFEFYLNFFRSLHHIYFKNKEVKKLDDTIHELIGNIFGENENLSWGFFRTFYHSITYLMGCNALKEGRESITCEDVVIAYLTGFKIILNDIRPLVYELYDEEKWKDESSWK